MRFSARPLFVVLLPLAVLLFPGKMPAQAEPGAPDRRPDTVQKPAEEAPKTITLPRRTRPQAVPRYPDDWSDLFEEDRDIYGSEKEEKYDVNAFFVEVENWPGHYSRKILWLYRYTDYPRYRSRRFLPFYYHLESKRDNREKTLSPFYYNKVEGKRSYSAAWPLLPFPLVVWGEHRDRDGGYHGVLPFYYKRDDRRAGKRGHLSWSWAHYLREHEGLGGVFLTWGYYSSREFVRKIGPRDVTRTMEETRVTPFSYSRKLYPVPGKTNDPDRIRSERPTESVSAASFLFIPFWKRARTREYDSLLAGPYYTRTEKNTKRRVTHLVPFYYGRADDRSRLDYYSLFYILPLHYHRSDKTGTSRYSGLLYYRRHDARGQLQTSHFIPLWFYKRNRYLAIPLLLWFSGKERDAQGKAVAGTSWYGPVRRSYDTRTGRSSFFSPVFFDKDTKEYNRQWSWLHYHYTSHEKDADHKSTRAYGLFPPLLPLYYKKQTKEYTRTNVLALYDHKADAKGKTLRRWLIPFYFHNRDSATGRSSWIVPPVQRRVNPKTGERALHVWPVYFSWRTDYSDPERDEARGSSVVANPLWYSRREQTVTRSETTSSSKTWVPIIPLVYASRHSSTEGSYRRILNVSYSKGADGKTKRRAFIPFYFHGLEPGGHLHVFPFYHRPASADPKRGVAFGFPLFYHRWEPDRHRFLLLNYYSSRDEKLDRERRIFFPFVFKSRDGVKRREFLTYKYEYEDEDEFYRLFFGVVSLNQQFGPLSPGLSFGTRGDSYHFDTDFGVLFNLFRLEKRISFPAPAFLRQKTRAPPDREKLAAIARQEEKRKTASKKPPRLVRKFIWNKDDYRSYWGMSGLFGAVAYKKADGVSHFRILPLYWFTWHEDESEGITTVPGFYLNYKTQETRYFYSGILMLPIFARQREGKSYTNVYPLFTVISSYNDSTKIRKQRYLFGLGGWTGGPTESGSYAFPFYYYHRKQSGDETRALSWSLVHWHRSSRRVVTDPKTGAKRSERRSKTFGPLFYRRVRETGPLPASAAGGTARNGGRQAKTERDSTLFLPFYYARKTPERESWSVWGLVNSSQDKTNNEKSFSILFGALGFSNRPGSGRTALLPFYYGKRTVSGKPNTPGYYSESEGWIPLLGLYKSKITDTGTGPGARRKISRWSLFFDYDRNKFADSSDWSLWVPFLPLLYFGEGDESETTHNVLTGLVYHYNRNRPSRTTSHSALWSLVKTSYGPGKFQARVLPLFSYSHKRWDQALDGSIEFRRRWWVLPLAYYRHERWKDGSYQRKALSMLPIFYYKDYYNVQGQNRSTGRKIVRRATKRWLLPFYYSSADTLNGRTERETFWLLPYYSNHDLTQKSSTVFVLPGFYFKTTPKYRRRNFLYLYDTVRDDERKYFARRALFGAVSYSKTPEERRFSLLYRGLYGERYRNAQDYDRNILWWINSVGRNEYHNSFLPFWYYDREGERKTLSILGPLWYQHTSPESDMELALGGLAWFRRYDHYERRGIALAGLGLGYIGRQKAERGYHSHGVFWNLLWQHQYEKENRYTKTSILKGIIYSRVTDRHGNSWRRILGVKFGYRKAAEK